MSNRVRFGDFVVDLAAGELLKDGSRVALQGKPFEILALLLRRPRELVPRHEILRSVWADTFVEGDLCLNVAIRRLRAALDDNASDPRFVETVGSRGYRFISDVHPIPTREPMARSREHPRVAIFPFKKLTRSESASFGRTLTDLLIAQLRQMDPQFALVTPEFTTERARKSTLALCRAASVDYVVVGAASRIDKQLRVIARLLDCRAEACIWAQTYTTEGEDIFVSQQELAQMIAVAVIRSIPVVMGPVRLDAVPPGAHELYQQGCSLLSTLTEPGVNRAIPLLEAAAREYPRFALAWAALANSYCTLARLGVVAPRKAFPKARAAADQAIDIEDSAEARTGLACCDLLYEHNWDAAEANLVRALGLNHAYPLALGAYAQLLASLGKHQDAVTMMRQARDLDPFAGYTAMMLGWALYYAGEYEESLAQLKRSLKLDPALWMTRANIGLVLDRMQRRDEAVVEFRLAVDHSANSALSKAHLAYGLAKHGDKADAIQILNSLLKLREKRYFSPCWIAAVHMALGGPSEALTWLKIAAEERCSWIVFVREDPKFGELRSDPRFRQISETIAPPRVSASAM